MTEPWLCWLRESWVTLPPLLVGWRVEVGVLLFLSFSSFVLRLLELEPWPRDGEL